MTIPKHCGMPPLQWTAEALRAHSLVVSVFMPEPDVSPQKRRWRSWLVHCLVKSARHYDESRRLILDQVAEGKRSSAEMMQGRQLPILDFAFEMEDCITSLDKAVTCLVALSKGGDVAATRVLALNDEGDSLRAIRNQQEHMHKQVAAGQTGNGPVLVTLDASGDGIHFRDLRMTFDALHRLLAAVHQDVAAIFSGYDLAKAAAVPGVPTLSISGTIEVTRGGADGSVS